MDLFPAFLSYVALCALVALEAARQGRFVVGILLFSFLLTPVVTLWYLILTGPAKPRGSVGPIYASARNPNDRFRDESRRRPIPPSRPRPRDSRP